MYIRHMTNTQLLAAAKTTVVEAHNLKPKTASKPASYILSALGHPNYGRTFSERAILLMADHPYLSTHQVVYGLMGGSYGK